MHPGTSKNKMVNASLIAMEFAAMLPPAEKPEHTEGYEGFYHLLGMEGRCEEATLTYILRDHDENILRAREDFVRRAAAYLNAKYGDGTVEVEIKQSYKNMTDVIRENWHLIEVAYKAVEQCGGKPHTIPVRGGTDGSRLSFMGLPCPNLGTGSHNAHSRMEYASVQAMDKVAQSLAAIAELYTDMEINFCNMAK
jgi:tripeptide aminopeptidase